jgi:hypothetical protein
MEGQMASLVAKVNSEQKSTGYSQPDSDGRRASTSIATVRIDPHPQNGMILRRLAPDGGDVHSTRHPDEASAKKTALDEFQVKLDEWTPTTP